MRYSHSRERYSCVVVYVDVAVVVVDLPDRIFPPTHYAHMLSS
jgi:hypothetical protein